METFFRDLRFGLRVLARNAGFTAAVVVVLALGIGANTVIFSVIHAVLLRPLPYPDADRLVQMWEVNRSQDGAPGTISPFNFLDWAAQNESFESMAVYAFSSFTLMEADGPSPLFGLRVSGDFFSVFGVAPMLGRTFGAGDDRPGRRVAVLSHRTWERRFGADPGVIGKKLTLDGEPYTVVAVMPRGFQFSHRGTELWVPPAFELAGLDRSQHFLFGVGRLKTGVSLDTAQSEATAIAYRLEQQHPAFNQGSGILLVPLQEQMVGKVRHELLILWGAVALVLLIACANVANLLLARVVSRQREVSVRIALGAGRARIVRQLLTECLLLVMMGGAAGLALAAWGARYLASGGAPGIPRAQDIHVDGWVLAFSAAVSLVTAVLFGIAPAFHASRSERYARLNQSGWQMPRGSLSQRLPKLVVAFEVGIAVVLLVSAALLLRSLYLLRQVEVGFNPRGLLTLQLTLPPAAHPDPVKRAALFQQVIERIAVLPGVDGVGGVNDLPFSGSRTQNSFDIVGLPPQAAAEPRHADYRTVAGDYFRIMEIALLKGRTFERRDGPQAPPVAVVNDALARRFFHHRDPLGRSLVIQGSAVEIIGVVENLKHDSLAAADAPEIYVPFSQGHAPEWIFLTVRSGLALEPLVSAIRGAVREVIAEHPLYNIQSMEERLASAVAPQRFNSLILSLFASLALILSAVGIYGVVAYAVRQRAHEIAVRMAIGARRADVIRLVVVNGFIPAAVGTMIGLAGAWAAARLLRGMLFGIGPTDPATFTAAPLALAGVALLAAYASARRAAAIDPMAAFRGE
jgi:putative ABC transport system permease protein